MKRMMSLMLGLALVIGTTVSAFSQEPQKTEKKKKGGKKKNKEDKGEKKS